MTVRNRTIPKSSINVKEFHIDQTLTLVGCDAQELEPTARYGGLFGIVMIMDGEGVLHLRDDSWHYESHRIFLLSPGQSSQFTAFYKTSLLAVFFDPFRVAGAAESSVGLFRNVRDIFSAKHLADFKEFTDELDRASVIQLARLIEQELGNPGEPNRDLIVSGVSVIVSLMVKNLTRSALPENLVHYNEETSRVLTHVRRRLRVDEHVTIQEIAAELGISQYNLNKLIIKGTGETLRTILSRYRTEFSRARQLDLQD